MFPNGSTKLRDWDWGSIKQKTEIMEIQSNY